MTIGTPLPNYGLMVVDEQRRPLPAGEVGELCIFGPGLAIGYLGRPELTADRFVANPLAEAPDEARLYLTGDLGAHRRRRRGSLPGPGGRPGQGSRFPRGIGRDRGGPGRSARRRGGGRGAATAGRDRCSWWASSCRVRAKVIWSRRRCARRWRSRLPPYMVPAHFEFVSQLPRLASGKSTARRLPRRVSAASRDGPRSQRSRRAAQPGRRGAYARSKSSSPAAARPDADFFDDLGGHSLLAARLVSACAPIRGTRR